MRLGKNGYEETARKEKDEAKKGESV